MAALSRYAGHSIVWRDGAWRYVGTGETISKGRACARCQASAVLVPILSSDGRWQTAAVDVCIAPLVQALNAGGIATIASCCGHGRRPGNIALRDGREFIIAHDWEDARWIEMAIERASGTPSTQG